MDPAIIASSIAGGLGRPLPLGEIGVLLPLRIVEITVYMCAGLQQFILWKRRRGAGLHLLFAGMCLFIAGYIFGVLWMERALAMERFLFTLKMQAAFLPLYYICFTWFASKYAAFKPRLFLWAMTLAYAALFVENLMAPASMFYSDVRSLTLLTMPWGEALVAPDADLSPWYHAYLVLQWMSLLFCGWCSVRLLRQGKRRKGWRLGAAILVFMSTVLNDTSVDMGLLNNLYLGELGAFAFVLLMTSDLSDSLWRQLERSNTLLQGEIDERVQVEKELKKHQGRLEDLVRERTEKLETANSDLTRAKEEAEAANHAKSEFLANMSHELRTPLNVILGFSEILSQMITDPAHLEYFRGIRSCGRSLLTMINDILDLSRIEAGKLHLHNVPVSVHHLLDEVADMFAHKTAEKDLDMETTVVGDAPGALLLDRARLRQVLVNLVGNAVKFTETGRIVLGARVEQPARDIESNATLVVWVRDTGVGIEPDQLEAIFGVFEQQKGQSVERFGGSGLGLAISRRLVEVMNGRITASSAPGAGSTFTVTLEGVETSSSELYTTDREPFDFESVHFDPAKILVVDDIQYNRDLLRSYLGNYDLKILEAQNGREAIEMTRRVRPDLVLMDMKMPEMDGYRASGIIKEDKELKATPVVAVTASALKQDEERITRICDGYLRKPVTRKQLVMEVMKHLPYTEQETNKDGKPASSIRERRERIYSAFARLPREMRKDFRTTVEMGSFKEIETAVERIAEKDAELARSLQTMARTFDYLGLMKTIESEETKT